MDKKPTLVIFLTVFIDLIGFGIIIPLSPYLAREYGATAFEVGLLMAIYSGLQFLFSPFWGQISDRVGRRPVLLLSLLGTAAAHAFFYSSTNLLGLFLARALAGFFSANISTAMAYMADVSGEKDRSKNMGLIGAAFGLGFVFGPALGGTLSRFGENFPAIVASGICLANFIFAFFVLKESLPPEKRQPRLRRSRLISLVEKLKRPLTGPLLVAYFAFALAMANMEASLFLLMSDKFGWTMEKASFGFAYVGVCIAFTQGFLVRKLLPKYGERVLIVIGFSVFMAAMFTIGLAGSIAVMAVAMTGLALGNGLLQPALNGTLSVLARPEEQGEMMGVAQSLAALGRILGPPLGGYLYQSLASSAPFVAAGTAGLVALIIVVKIRSQIPQSALSRAPAAH